MSTMALARLVTCLCCCCICSAVVAASQADAQSSLLHSSLEGSWTFAANGSDQMLFFTPTTLNISINSTATSDASRQLSIQRGFSAGDAKVTLSALCPDDPTRPGSAAVSSRVYVYNIFLGVELNVNSTVSCTADISPAVQNACRQCEEAGAASASNVTLDVSYQLLTSQGYTTAHERHTLQVVSTTNGPDQLRYHVVNADMALNYTFLYVRNGTMHSADWQDASPTDSQAPVKGRARAERSVSVPASTQHIVWSSNSPATAKMSKPSAFNYDVPDNFSVASPVFHETLAVLSLQGLVNRDEPLLYLTYPADWDYTFTPMVREFYSSSHGFAFDNVSSLDGLLSQPKLRSKVKGYIIWDSSVRDSIMVALTAAGLTHSLVISADLIPLMEQHGIAETSDLRGRFRNMTTVEIYTYAKEHYFNQCNTSFVVFLGGECGSILKPGIADWGVENQAFFVDLSTLPGSDEYPLAASIVDDLARRSGGDFLLQGWHSYCKDYEHTFTTLASRFGGRVHGLHTNPNLSFTSRVKLPPGYRFRNHYGRPASTSNRSSSKPHSPPIDPSPGHNKTLITMVQTDGLGLGAWNSPHRGTFHYAWEVTLPDLHIQPTLLQMFYEQATPKDFFVGALSGPGYMYPKAVPKTALPQLLHMAAKDMQTLDLSHMIIFDASQAVGEHTISGNTNLSPEVVEAYINAMPNTTAWLNGYGPSFTFAQAKDNRSLASFEYYLDPSRSVDGVVADIELLAAVNDRRPYFLPIHVREFSGIDRIGEILSKLDPNEFEVVGFDVFAEALNEHNNQHHRYQQAD